VPLAPPGGLDDSDWIGPVFVGTPPPVGLRQPYAPVEVAPRPAPGVPTEASTPVRQREDTRALALDHPVLFQARSALIMVAILSVALVVQLAWVSNWVHRSSQVSLFNRFRTELALGTGPIGATKPALAIGQPMALIEIPSIGVKQVVVEGTTGGALALGPGHLRSTVFPGGVGDSVIMGRAASYGGPFGRLHQLHRGNTITVVTQVGTARFRVLGVREAGGAPYRVSSRAAILTLQTAYGPNYAPSGVVTVTAEATGTALDSQRPPVAVVPPSQRPLGVDTGALSSLLLWLIGLAAVLGAAVWTWHRRGHLQTWIVFGAPLALIWFFVADQVTRILPNLL
jgi:LPXTG-site transpeptidase (sortase) family protein